MVNIKNVNISEEEGVSQSFTDQTNQSPDRVTLLIHCCAQKMEKKKKIAAPSQETDEMNSKKK